jgi:hypothetical protein
MTEDGKPLETLLEDAARARRLAIVLDGDPAALLSIAVEWARTVVIALQSQVSSTDGVSHAPRFLCVETPRI